MSKFYEVVVPFAGHVLVRVEAESKKEATDNAICKGLIFTAKDEDGVAADILDLETLSRFNDGAVCYCPAPWQAEAEEVEA
jgi:hypothetical protein